MKYENLKKLVKILQEDMTVIEIHNAVKELTDLIIRSEKMENALEDIKNWNEELEYVWDDPENRASEALKD